MLDWTLDKEWSIDWTLLQSQDQSVHWTYDQEQDQDQALGLTQTTGKPHLCLGNFPASMLTFIWEKFLVARENKFNRKDFSRDD